jgi:hypothetical protein
MEDWIKEILKEVESMTPEQLKEAKDWCSTND